MIDHITVQVADVDVSAQFYQAVLKPCGMEIMDKCDGGIGFGANGRSQFWIIPAAQPEDRELHIAFSVPDRASVHDFHRAAVDIGAEVLHAPKLHPEYEENYYACYVRDPDGHNIEAVNRGERG